MVKINKIQENNNMNTKERLRIFGINVKSQRLRKGLSQEELAEVCEISRNSVSLIETGKLNPTILKVLDISKALGTTIEALLLDVK